MGEDEVHHPDLPFQLRAGKKAAAAVHEGKTGDRILRVQELVRGVQVPGPPAQKGQGADGGKGQGGLGKRKGGRFFTFFHGSSPRPRKRGRKRTARHRLKRPGRWVSRGWGPNPSLRKDRAGPLPLRR